LTPTSLLASSPRARGTWPTSADSATRWAASGSSPTAASSTGSSSPLQQVIQVAAAVAAHVLADSPGGRPSTFAGLFEALAERELIDRSLAGRLSGMARFRDVLVHRFGDVDPERVWDIVDTDLGDLEQFLHDVAHPVVAGR
jgi:uncharacterized protein YutE (UPF0331/DUF86 family)